MTERLSALDASFLAVEGPQSPMHVGWVALFDPPEEGRRPRYEELFEYVASRLERAPRYRQRLADVPFGVHEPVWVDDAAFDPEDHLLPAGDMSLDELVDTVFSTQLARDRPLWEMWFHDELPDGGVAMVGKAHHCMVDGVAAMQLANLLLDRDPDAGSARGRDGWAAAPVPSAGARLAQAVADRTVDIVSPLRLAASPGRLFGLPRAATRGARTLAHTVLPPAPGSPLNHTGSGRRHHIRLARDLDDLRTVRKRFGVTPNDVVLAAVAGGLRRFAERRGEQPRKLKAMVPADVRSGTDAAEGNRISFLFIELPCDEPDPAARLAAVHRATAQRARDGEAEDVDTALQALALAPRPVRRALAHAVAHPRLFNLVVSSLPGPATARYLHGCRLRELYSAVPLAGRHALSIGILMVAGRACFGIYTDPVTLPDADAFAEDLNAALDELLAARP
jgi:WS/DGAT/MGAT family acyltransferase